LFRTPFQYHEIDVVAVEPHTLGYPEPDRLGETFMIGACG